MNLCIVAEFTRCHEGRVYVFQYYSWGIVLGFLKISTPGIRRGIAGRGGGHMKGVESIYMSGEMAIEVGSAGEGQTGLGRRPSPLLNQSGDPMESRYSTWHGHEFKTLMKKIRNTFTLLAKNAQPRLDTHQKGRGIVERGE
jgi:hypothetical protein